jgi:hypothetical protein
MPCVRPVIVMPGVEELIVRSAPTASGGAPPNSASGMLEFSNPHVSEEYCTTASAFQAFTKELGVVLVCTFLSVLVMVINSFVAASYPSISYLCWGMAWASLSVYGIGLGFVFHGGDNNVRVACADGCFPLVGIAFLGLNSVWSGLLCCKCTMTHYIRGLWYTQHRTYQLLTGIADVLEIIVAIAVAAVGYPLVVINIFVAAGRLAFKIWRFRQRTNEYVLEEASRVGVRNTPPTVATIEYHIV